VNLFAPPPIKLLPLPTLVMPLVFISALCSVQSPAYDNLYSPLKVATTNIQFTIGRRKIRWKEKRRK